MACIAVEAQGAGCLMKDSQELFTKSRETAWTNPHGRDP